MESLTDFFNLQSFRSELQSDLLSEWEKAIHNNIFCLTQWSGILKSDSIIKKGWNDENIYLADEIVSDLVYSFYLILRTEDAEKMRMAARFISTDAKNLSNIGRFEGEYKIALDNLINIESLSK